MDSPRPFGWQYLQLRTKYRDFPMGIDSTRLGWMAVLRWKAWIRLGCPGCELGVSVAHGHRYLAAMNWNKKELANRNEDVLGNHLLMGVWLFDDRLRCPIDHPAVRFEDSSTIRPSGRGFVRLVRFFSTIPTTVDDFSDPVKFSRRFRIEDSSDSIFSLDDFNSIVYNHDRFSLPNNPVMNCDETNHIEQSRPQLDVNSGVTTMMMMAEIEMRDKEVIVMKKT
ncbi:hypothetical protein AtNW77_Chr1g0037721 [Arabidopsis thaliana]|uniref:Uncharacterized protein n=1 Tax=Arabidopsis thaliana TaxID=3702 RepID=A0A654EF49_ARATH|nr:unnamed protein product [Arabidopsis thaliana]